MSLKEILKRNPNLTLKDLQELQKLYDERFVDQKFETSLQKVEHTFAHMGKLLGKLAGYVEAMEEGKHVSADDIKNKVIPDLLIYSAWLAKEFDVNIEKAFLQRFVGNLRRLYADKVSQEELEELEGLVRGRGG